MNIVFAFRPVPVLAVFLLSLLAVVSHANEKHLAYLVSDDRIPFWNIMSAGIRHKADELGYRVSVHSAGNLARRELENVVEVIGMPVDGIILSPTNSSAAATVLRLAEQANVPVVISDIGADSDNYVSYIESDNDQGAYDLGVLLASALTEKERAAGSVGIIAIPQKRANGRARTNGFMRALAEHGLEAAGIRQQTDFSYQETYEFARSLIAENEDLRAIWLQGSNQYQAALAAISESAKPEEILLISFDAEPEFIEMIAKGELVGAGMQQPYLMGERAVESMHRFLSGDDVEKTQRLKVLPVSTQNLERLLPTIKRNVLGEGGEP